MTALLHRENDDAFVIFEEQISGKFVQFAGSADEELLLDLPTQSLSEVEQARAKRFFEALKISGPRKYALYADKTLEIIGGVQTSFQTKFGRDPQLAARVALDIFEQVYEFPKDFVLIVAEN